MIVVADNKKVASCDLSELLDKKTFIENTKEKLLFLLSIVLVTVLMLVVVIIVEYSARKFSIKREIFAYLFWIIIALIYLLAFIFLPLEVFLEIFLKK